MYCDIKCDRNSYISLIQVCELEFGFRGNEIQHIVTTVPKVLIANKRKLTQIFDFVHNTMDVPHSLIAKFPQVHII